MKKKVLWAAIALMVAATLSACSKSDDGTDGTKPGEPTETPGEPTETPDEPLSNEDNELKYISLTRAEQDLVNENNNFAFNLFRKVTSEKSEIVSPISITYALGMLNNGAAGETQKEINKVLGFGETGADGINDFCRKMLTEAPTLDKLTKVMIANTIYMNKGYELKSDFIDKANTYYDAEPETREFNEETRQVINKWGNDHTEGMIPEVLKPNEFNPSSVSYLLNAIYFKGAWAEKFDKGNTKDEAFKGYSAEKQVPMMHQEHEFSYTETDDCQALCLPYGNNAYRMTILLPKEGKTINDVLKTLTAESWQRYQFMGSAIVDVKLPRFESESDIKLIDIMSELGMPRAFDPYLAEFPNFCNVPVFISMMKQVAKIKLNEEGTEAAAITVIGIKTTAVAPEPQHVQFFANRPFLYVISEFSTGAIFFIGQYMGD
ncbi:MAG: serpin family protein [Prevotella sp.]|nr:serpin family protein [Prevotella sp.]